MTRPTFDADGYPTDETLERIRTWAIESNDDFAAVMDFAGSAWSYPDQWECIERWVDPDGPPFPKRVYRFSTGGWSGNESIQSAIEGNQMVQLIGAWSWRRGGHFEYRFPIVGVATAALLSGPTPSELSLIAETDPAEAHQVIASWTRGEG